MLYVLKCCFLVIFVIFNNYSGAWGLSFKLVVLWQKFIDGLAMSKLLACEQ